MRSDIKVGSVFIFDRSFDPVPRVVIEIHQNSLICVDSENKVIRFDGITMSWATIIGELRDYDKDHIQKLLRNQFPEYYI